MNPSKRKSLSPAAGAALAVAAAGLFLSSVPPASAQDAKVHCEGANACKGKSACSTAKNACKGQNACKGEGWESLTAKECESRGGKTKKD